MQINTPNGEINHLQCDDIYIWKRSYKYKVILGNKTYNMYLRDVTNNKEELWNTYSYNAEIIVPYTDPADGKTYDLNFAFGTFQEFERENGTKFNGLGLTTYYTIPTCNIQFDETEPTNPKLFDYNSSTSSSGYNVWKYSNLRQWLNKSGKNWYTPQHEYDAPPKIDPETGRGVDPSKHAAFLSCIPTDFTDTDIPIKINTTLGSIGSSLLGAPSSYITSYDTFFALSLPQYNVIVRSSGRMTPEIDGRYWEYWKKDNPAYGYVGLKTYTIEMRTSGRDTNGVTIGVHSRTAVGTGGTMPFREGYNAIRANNTWCLRALPSCVI